MPFGIDAETNAKGEFDRLHALVLNDEALQARLDATDDLAEFLAGVVKAARDRDIDLDVETLQARLDRPRRDAPPPMIEDLSPQAGWLPVDVSREEPFSVEWAYFGRRRLSEPFYGDSALRIGWRPFNRLFRVRTPLARLHPWSQDVPTLQPDGFIFHMSRCGSTLTAQMLGALDANIVVSEAGPINAMVLLNRAAPEIDEAAQVALLKAMIGVFGQRRNAGEGRYFVKLDCWHILSLPLFRRAFPSTPWVFLYREPVEVMVSQVRQRGVQMVPQFVPPDVYGLDLPSGVPDEDYWARVLAVLCEAALDEQARGGGLLINYRQLPQALSEQILPHFGIVCDADERAALEHAARRDAKQPEQTFAPDSQAKQQAVTHAIKIACERHLSGVHDRLEVARTAQVRRP